MLRIGLDVGSTTLKCIVLDERNNILFKDYKRHRSMVRQIAADFIETILQLEGADDEVHLAVTGSAGMGLAETYHLPFVQEVVATQIAVETLHPGIDVVIELGGEDAKILFLTGGTEVRMNGSCAGGTGAFIDQMAVLLDTDLQTFDAMALEAKQIYPIASRCGVFAKSDVQPLLNQGAAKTDVAMSIYHAVVNQTISGLAQGRDIKGDMMFLGGPLTFFKGLQNAFKDILKLEEAQYHFPDNAQYYVAYGAALYSRNAERIVPVEVLEALRTADVAAFAGSGIEPLFADQAEYDAFLARHNSSKIERADLSCYEYPVFVGIDAGSTTVKLVVIGQHGELLYEMYQPSNGKPVEAVRNTLLDIYRIKPDVRIAASAVTGYGEDLIRTAFHIDYGVVETIAHLTAAKQFMPNVDFIIDIGGQDMKCFKIRNGAIDTIFLNEACSSGCGSFISTFAVALGHNVSDFGKLGLFAKYPVDLGSRCTVFMNSSVKQAQKEGAGVDDLSAGLSISVVKNALYKVIRVHSIEELGEHIVVQGGTFYNDAILRAFEKEVKGEVVRPEIAGLMGAYGCAVYAENQARETSGMLDYEALMNFTQDTRAEQCQLCGNHCQLTISTFDGTREMIAGNRCERPLKQAVVEEALPNEYDFKRKRIASVRTQPKLENARGTIGIPMGLNLYEMYPFWNALWRSLNFNVIFSPFGSKKIYLDGQHTIPSDTVCYPAKLMHGHIEYLMRKKPDAIFYPCLSYNFDENISDNHYNCPVVAYYPQVLDANVGHLSETQFLFPFYGVHQKKHFKKTIAKDLKRWFGISSKETGRAVNAAYQAQQAYQEDVDRFCNEAIITARERGVPIIVLAGRPYHIDPEINHGIDTLIESFGAAVIAEDAFMPMRKNKKTGVLNQWTYHARLYNAADVVTHHEDMAMIQLVSFGCGLDAITTDEVRDILEREGSLYTQIKIDEIANLGAVKIRLRSLFATMNQKREERTRHAV